MRNNSASGSQSADRRNGTSTPPGPEARALLFWASAVTLALCFIPSPYNDILWPIRLFVTMIHESGHAITTLLTGGSVQYIQIHANGEGVTLSSTADWPRWLVYSGGYLGTTIFGAVLLQVVRRSGHKVTLTMIGVYLALETLLWCNNPFDNTFTLVTGITLSVLFFIAAQKLTPKAAGFLVAFIAVQCCLNAIGDLRILLYLTTAAPGTDNDAAFMAKIYHMPATLFAGVWAVIAVAILSLSLWRYLRATSGGGSKRRKALST